MVSNIFFDYEVQSAYFILLLNIHHRMKSITLHNLVFDKICKYVLEVYESLSIFMLFEHYTHNMLYNTCNIILNLYFL